MSVEVVELERLPAPWGLHREAALFKLTSAYAEVADGRQQNYKAWHATVGRITETLKHQFMEAGLEAPPLNWDALWRRVDLLMPAMDAHAHVDFVNALFTDYGPRLWEHIEYRVNHDGNVHFAFRGPTGMGKSSCMIGVADAMKPIPAVALVDRLAIDVGDAMTKLGALERGDTMMVDEELAAVGEGSRTAKEAMANTEDTLRASGRHFFWSAPEGGEHTTLQASLEVIAWNPQKKWSLFIVWMGPRPVGVVALPWCRPELYAVYKPWKDENVARTLRGAFKDNRATARQMVAAFKNPDFVDYLLLGANKPKKTDFETAVELFVPQMMSGTQVKRLVDFMHLCCYGFERLEAKVIQWVGGAPPAGFLQVADKCYKE